MVSKGNIFYYLNVCMVEVSRIFEMFIDFVFGNVYKEGLYVCVVEVKSNNY